MEIVMFFGIIAFLFKHFIADFQFNSYPEQYSEGADGFLKLAQHAGFHGLLTFFIASMLTKDLSLSFVLGVFDFTFHFIVDRIKTSEFMLGRYEYLSKKEISYIKEWTRQNGSNREIDNILKGNRRFWLTFGATQAINKSIDAFILLVIIQSMLEGIK